MISVSAVIAVCFSALGYGSYFVPVKKYDVYDGVIYQWFMCCGIQFGSLSLALARNDWTATAMTSTGFYVAREGLASGLLWVMGNVFANKCVQYFGLGNYYIWHELTNLGGTFFIGVLGPSFGIPATPPSNVPLAAFGFLCILLAMTPVAFMKPEEAPAVGDARPADTSLKETASSRDSTGSGNNLHALFERPAGELSASGRSLQTVFEHQAGSSIPLNQVAQPSFRDTNAHTWDGTIGRHDLDLLSGDSRTVGSFGSFGDTAAMAMMQGRRQSAQEEGQLEMPSSNSWLKGWVLSLVTGVIYALTYAPMLPWRHRLEKAGYKVSGVDYMFSLTSGIFVFSTIWLLIASGIRKMRRLPMQRSVLRPPMLAGLLWFLGSVCQVYAQVEMPYAIAYCFVCGGGLAVSLCWGIFRFKEATTSHNRKCVTLTFAGMFVGIALLGLST
eukprot:gnl/TRDRNA2_/TRDRNA2_163457_c0_seq2.p1 gnl/TRDRNA2_/TRDRNA2_163457_c0~~gnl/TRDRNA2_/TRDRNA2_163457_c0_seq2.p1  ORF type:complete len:443 (-),score=38.54 gnl/TRDRNA2_/TRDRNA2_163457_c0_seq2:14-1342(-)